MKSSGARAPCEGLGQARHGLLREREREVTERCEAREEEERKRKGRGARSGLVRRQRSPEEGKGGGQQGAAGAAPAGRWRRTGGSGLRPELLLLPVDDGDSTRWEAAGSSSPWLATRGTGRSAWAVVVGWIGKEEAGRLGMDPEGDFWSGGGRMGMGQAS